MAQSQALEAQEKKELVSKEEKTVPSRYYVPNTDIHETDDALVIVYGGAGRRQEGPERGP